LYYIIKGKFSRNYPTNKNNVWHKIVKKMMSIGCEGMKYSTKRDIALNQDLWKKSTCKRRFFGNSFTESTSTKRVFLRKRCIGSARRTASVERIEVHNTITSGCSSQKSSASLHSNDPEQRRQ
jgi:ribosomal protein L37AE/L43A